MRSHYLKLLILCVVEGIGLATAFCHADPWGDVHPEVRVENGCFAVYFHTYLPERALGHLVKDDDNFDYRMVFTSAGRLLAPRHQVGESEKYKRLKERETKKGAVVGLQTPGFEIVGKNGGLARYLLPPMRGLDSLDLRDTVSMSEGIGMTAVELDSADKLSARPEKFVFFWYPFGKDEEPKRIEIGLPIYIYTFPTASNVVFAGGRFWIAIMSQEAKLVLWSWKPGEEKPRTKILDSPYHWNCDLSLAAIDDRLCLAYHCATSLGGYGENARIFTVFEKAE